MMAGRFGLRGVEVPEQPCREELATLTKEAALIVSQGEDPGQLRGGSAARASIGPGDPGRCQSRAAERRAPGTVRGQQALERTPREATMTTWGGEDTKTPRVDPAPQRVVLGRLLAAVQKNNGAAAPNLPERGRLAHSTKLAAPTLWPYGQSSPSPWTRTAPTVAFVVSSMRIAEPVTRLDR